MICSGKDENSDLAEPSLEGGIMSSIVKVTEVIAQSQKGFDDAVRNAVTEAAKTIRGIK